MGSDRRLADALFPAVQQRLLALLFSSPDRSFQSAELIRLADGGTGGVHRLLTRLSDAGWLSVTRIGNQKHYRCNRACPAFAELHELVLKTLRTPGTSSVAPQPASVAPQPARKGARKKVRTVPPPFRERPPAPEPAPSTPPPEPGDGWKTW